MYNDRLGVNKGAQGCLDHRLTCQWHHVRQFAGRDSGHISLKVRAPTMTLSYFTGMLECLSSSFLLIRATIGADELVFSILVGPCTCSLRSMWLTWVQWADSDAYRSEPSRRNETTWASGRVHHGCTCPGSPPKKSGHS